MILNGWGVGETHYGGYAQMARVKGDWLVQKPAAFSAAEAMAIGTAGYTAMLCVLALERHGVTPESGPVLVTGAAGGVGSVAIALLAKLGYQVTASTGRASEADYLKGLGAAEIIDRAELAGKPRPLNRERWAGAVDAVGSNTLANALSMTKYGGTVAACGLAGGMDLPTSVAPFILRGVTLAGINSVMAPKARAGRGVGAARARSRQGQARRHDGDAAGGGCGGAGAGYSRRQGAGAGGVGVGVAPVGWVGVKRCSGVDPQTRLRTNIDDFR